MKFRQLLFWSMLASVVWVGADGMLKAQFGNTKPSGLALITWTESGYTALNLWADDYGYGSSGGVVIYDDGTGVQIAYAQDATPAVFKAAVAMQGASLVTTGGAWNSSHAALWAAFQPDFATYNSLPAGESNDASCPYGVTAGVDVDGFALMFIVSTGSGFGQQYISTESNPGPWSWAELKGFFEDCQNGQVNNTIEINSPAHHQYAAISKSSGLLSCCDGGGGGPGGGCGGSCQFTWYSFGPGIGAWSQSGGDCSCKCCPPSGSGSSNGQTAGGSCVAVGATCGADDPPPPGPCEEYGGDGDGDGCCANIDCNDGDASKCTSCGGGDPDPEECEDDGGDADEDGCCDDDDYDTTDPDVCEDEDSTDCGKCKWKLVDDGEPIPDPEDPEGTIQKYKWEKERSCKDEDKCECEKPEDDPNDEDTIRTQYTECDEDCKCDFDWQEKYDEFVERLQEWWPELDIANNGGNSVDIELPLLGVADPIEISFSYNPEDWAYGSAIGGQVRDWLRAMCILVMGYGIFMCVIKDINSL